MEIPVLFSSFGRPSQVLSLETVPVHLLRSMEIGLLNENWEMVPRCGVSADNGNGGQEFSYGPWESGHSELKSFTAVSGKVGDGRGEGGRVRVHCTAAILCALKWCRQGEGPQAGTNMDRVS